MTETQEERGIFFQVIENCSEPVVITDIDGVLLYVNPAWCRTYGYTAEEAMGQTPALLHSGLQDEAFYSEMWRSILDEKKHSWSGSLINRARDGRLIPVRLTVTHFTDERGMSLGYMGIANDLTHERELEDQARQQVHAMASLMQLFDEQLVSVLGDIGNVIDNLEGTFQDVEEDQDKKQLFDLVVKQRNRFDQVRHDLHGLRHRLQAADQSVTLS